MKYAIIRDGSKQYKVSEGATLTVERKDAQPGGTIEFGEVVLYADGDDVKVGTPTVAGAKVTATVEKEYQADKVTGIKFIRREGYRRKRGHRQRYTVVKITGVVAG